MSHSENLSSLLRLCIASIEEVINCQLPGSVLLEQSLAGTQTLLVQHSYLSAFPTDCKLF